jgi:hypothetical protein
MGVFAWRGHRSVVRVGLMSVVVAAAAVAVAVTVALAAWSPSTVLTTRGASPTVAGNGHDLTVAAWYLERAHSATVVVRVSQDGGRDWGADQALGGATEANGGAGAQVRVAVGADGRIVVVWQHLQRGHVAVMRALAGPGGRFGAPRVLSASGLDALDPDVAVDRSGEAVVVWVTEHGLVRAVLGPGGKLLSRRLIPGSTGAFEPVIAVSPDGDRLYGWVETGTGCDTCVVAARENVDGLLEPAQILSSPDGGYSADVPQVALGPHQRATVVWEEEIPSSSSSGIIQATSAPWGGQFSHPQQLSPTTPTSILGGGGFGARGIGVDAAGRVSAVWVQTPPGDQGTSLVRVATTGPSGRFDAARTLQREHGTLTYERPAIAVAQGGMILATWTVLEGVGSGSDGPPEVVGVWGAVSTRSRRGFAAPTKLSGPNGDQSAVAATSHNGAGLATFSDSASGLGPVDTSRWAP